MKRKNCLFLVTSILVLHLGAQTNRNAHALYEKSIRAVCLPQPGNINRNLVAINAENKNLVRKTIDGKEYILALSWKQDTTYYKNDPQTGFYNTGQYPIWVTAAPELLERFKTLNAADTLMRLKELLGLPPESVYSYFIEFWVSPSDLFRPCPDKEISDGACDLCFPANTDSAHIRWINQNRISRFYNCKPEENYPWTQLGYTYDWNPGNRTHFGLSEFVISPGSNIRVNKVYKTSVYLKRAKY